MYPEGYSIPDYLWNQYAHSIPTGTRVDTQEDVPGVSFLSPVSLDKQRNGEVAGASRISYSDST
jgi:hypothetical protein